MPHGIASGKFQGAITAATPRGASASCCARPAPARARGPLRGERLEGVVLEEVDRLAHVAVGLGPRLRALADLERRQLEPALAQKLRRPPQHLGALGRRPVPPGAEAGAAASTAAAASAWSRCRRAPPAAPARPGRSSRGRCGAALAAHEHRDLQRQPGIQPAQRLEQRLARRARAATPGSARSEAHGAAAAVRSARRAAARAGTTRWSVLEQPPHEVRHPGHDVADRAVDRTRKPARRRRCEVVAEPAQHLELEVAVLAAGSALPRHRVRDGAQVVRRDRRPHGGHASSSRR